MSSQNPYSTTVRPNVIWLMVDQMRMHALSIAGDPNVRTPNIDRLARDGLWFRNAVMGFPLCCPARGSILTGRYPHDCVPGHEYALPTQLTTVGDPFNAAGYHTAWFGKWHLDGHHESTGRGAWHVVPRERRGRFGTWIGYENNNSQWDSWVHGHRDDVEVPLQLLHGHETDVLTDTLLDYIDTHRDSPFFACCSLQPPHDPYSAPSAWAGRHNPATLELRPNVPRGGAIEREARVELAGYYALIEQIDANVGRVLEQLHTAGIHDHTYLVFFSDHGDQHGSHGHFRKMTPFEESIRVPCMIWGGHRLRYRALGTTDYPINHVDMAPTTLGLCGIPVPPAMCGYDYSPLVGTGAAVGATEAGSATPRIPADAPHEAYLQCVIPTGHGPSMDVPWRGIVDRDGWKYVAVRGQPLMLFNLNDDPYEQRNLAHMAWARPERARLNERLAQWVARTGDDFDLPQFDAQGRDSDIAALREQYAERWFDR